MHIRFGEFELDSRRFHLERRGEKIPLRPKVFDLLIVLARNRDRVVPREELVAELWGETQVGAGSLSGLVNELRNALAERGRGPSSIRTVHARGYQFVAPVEVLRGPETERGLLDRWLLERGLEPLPRELAEAILRHLSGRGRVPEEVFGPGMGREVGGAGCDEPAEAEASAPEAALPARPPIRSVRSVTRFRRSPGEGSA